jgi:hypothetical protein
MRRAAVLSALVLTAFAGAAVAAPTVDVSIGPNLQKKANKYGAREFDYLSRDLQHTFAHTPALDGAMVKLTISEATPNRPTFKQLGDRVGLSMQSIGIGGAKIEGTVTYPDGRVLPVKYSYYDHDIIEAIGSTTWSTAQRAFDLAARKVARDGAVVTR